MGTNIEWTDETWNPIVGCSIVSPGCTNCYAMKQAARIIAMAGDRNIGVHYDRTVKDVKGKPVWTGHVAQAPDATLTQPLRWKRGRRIFVNSMSDLFHESVPDEWIDRVFAVMALAPQHTFIVLTKRSKRMREYCRDPEAPRRITEAAEKIAIEVYDHHWLGALGNAGIGHAGSVVAWPLPNVHKGVSAEDQARADERIPDLLATPAVVRFVSAEPLLGPIDFEEAWNGYDALGGECWGDCRWCQDGHPPMHNCQRGKQTEEVFNKGRSGLDWIIVGGESGPGARPMQVAWARSVVAQCRAAGVKCFVKQLGADPVWEDGAFLNLKDRKGVDPAEWPEDLRVRELPWRTADA